MFPIKDQGMESINEKFPSHACQLCGSEAKLVETLIDDKFVWNENSKEYEPNEFVNDFDHTGIVRCSQCLEDWTGE